MVLSMSFLSWVLWERVGWLSQGNLNTRLPVSTSTSHLGTSSTSKEISPLIDIDTASSNHDRYYRVCGELHVCKQEHTPFDVVAWHGKCVPFYLPYSALDLTIEYRVTVTLRINITWRNLHMSVLSRRTISTRPSFAS